MALSAPPPSAPNPPASRATARPLLRASVAGVALTGLAALAGSGVAGPQDQQPGAPATLSQAQPAAPAAAPPAAATPAPAPALAPRVIMVIRHGEKPAKGHSLTARGWSRARVLPTLFAAPVDAGAPDSLPAPKVIYAAGATDAGTGQRTRETVSSLSSRLNVPVNTAYGKGQEASLVRQAVAQSENGPVLICWQHGEIPAIASAL
ncbi:MAG TPA: hypothetical protein VL595_30025 [Pseudonocardia sp.]|nr:hypothetical protein [Pseudonocardia sp.]